MKTLALLRHAKSVRDEQYRTDAKRPLADRGRRDAERIGRALSTAGYRPDLIVSSPSERTRETVAIIAPILGYPLDDVDWEQALYLAPMAGIEALVYGLDERFASVLLCGHNPGMEEYAQDLVGALLPKFPTCAFLKVEFDVEDWSSVDEMRVRSSSILLPAQLSAGNQA